MRTMNESEWVPAAGEPVYPPHFAGPSEPEVGDVEDAVTPEPETTPEPEVAAEPADGDTAGEAAPPQADPEPEAPPAE